MGRVYLNLVNGEWKKTDSGEFWLDEFIKNKLDNLNKIRAQDWDGVIIVDGKERSGKSVCAMGYAWYLSKGQISENNFASGLDDASRKIAELPDKSILIVDEGSLIFSAKDSLGKKQKLLTQILDVVGQKNMIFIICLPCFFDLNKTIAVRRSLFLTHIYADENYRRGQYAYWGEKKKNKLYTIGKKNFDSYSFPSAEFVGQFCDFKPEFYQRYLENIKKKSLQEVLNNANKDSPKSVDLTDLKAKLYINFRKMFPDLKQYEIINALDIPSTTLRDRLRNLNSKFILNEEKEEISNE